MSVVDLPVKVLTLDDVATLAAADPDHRYELQKGTLLVMPPPDREHAALVMILGAWLMNQGYRRGQVLAAPGIRVSRQDDPHATGRSPDIAVTREPGGGRTVWLDPGELLLVIEIVSPGSEAVDRVLKPGEYARAGIPNYWLVERDRSATVNTFRLGAGTNSEPVYVPHRAVLLDELLDSGNAKELLKD